MEQNKQYPHKEIGLYTDTELSSQPEGTSPFMLNALPDSVQGSKMTIQNENSNQLCVTLSSGEYIRGIITLNGSEKALLTYNDSTSFIHLFNNEKCTYQAYVTNADLNFQYPITGTSRSVKGCERVIYWRDSNNVDRFYNFDKPENFTVINDFALNPNLLIPQIDLQSVNDTGGNLPLGAYAFQLEYLTNNQEVVYRSYITPPTPIYDDSINQGYDSIDGGLNIDDNLADVGGVPATSKSITLNLSNLDTRFPYYRINVVRYINSDGLTPSTHRVSTLFPINSNTTTFTYVGFNPGNGDILLDYQEIVSPIIKYASSKDFEQVQNRLLRFNVTESSRDYSLYQKIVNNIVVTPSIKQVPINDQFTSGDPKNPKTPWDSMSEQSDEIYAKGIVFVYTDGTESPAFHIPGRASVNYDTELLTVGTDIAIEEVRHLDLNINDTVPRWKVFNTGSDITLSYHESTTGVYPLTVDCNGDYIFGDLAGQKVRHHHMPSRRSIPLIENGNINIIGLEYSNIQYPDPDIVGHYIVSAKRDSFNRTVLDSGYLYRALDFGGTTIGKKSIFGGSYYSGLDPNGVPLVVSPFQIESSNWIFWNPTTSYQKKYINGSYFNIINEVNYSEQSPGNYVFVDEYHSYPDDWDISIFRASVEFGISVNSNKAYLNNIIVNPYSSQNRVGEFNANIFNTSFSNALNFYRLQDKQEFPLTNGYTNPLWFGYYAVNKVVRDVYPNILNINYYRSHAGFFTGTESEVYGGDVFITKHNWFDLTRGITKDITAEIITDLFVESDINTSFRHGGSTGCNSIFTGDITTKQIGDYYLGKVSDFDGNNYISKGFPCGEFYKINPDLNRLSCDTNYQPLWLSYDYCSNCLNQYKTRIIWSQKSFQNDLGDNYRVYLANNFRDLPSNKGEIIAANYKDNKLIVRTTDTCYLLYPNPNTLQTNENTVYIGTGDFLSLPESEIIVDDVGYGGQQSVYSSANTPMGLCWVDEKRGKVFLFNQQLEEISKYGMYHFFDNNLPSNIKKDLESYGLTFNNDEFGCRVTYDPKFERIILHKRDFKATQELKSVLKNVQPQLTNKGFQTIVDSVLVKYDFTDPRWFENKSFTISFGQTGNSKGWLSFHSYQPDHLSYGSETFYSFLNNQIWSHDDYYSFTTYFNKQFPFVYEFVDKQFNTSNTHAIHYWATCHSFDEANQQWNEDNITFDKAVFYTNDQSTGRVSIIEPNELQKIQWLNNIKTAIQTDKNWKIAQIRDIANGSPVNSSAWNVIQSEYSDGQGYMDKLPLNVDFNTPMYELNDFRDKWIACRMFFTSNSHKMVVNLFLVDKQNSIR